jgi:hypothetical protein
MRIIFPSLEFIIAQNLKIGFVNSGFDLNLHSEPARLPAGTKFLLLTRQLQ